MPNSQFSGTFIHRLSKLLFLDRPAREVFIFTLKKLPHILKNNYQVIFPLNGFWQLLLLKFFQPFKGYKLVVTGHSGPGWDDRWNLYLRPNCFIALTKPQYDWAMSLLPSANVKLIPLAIGPKSFQVNPVNLSLERPIILCPSALVPYKRVELAIKAVSQLNKGSLVVLGKGPLKNHLIRAGNNLLPHRFLLTHVSHDEIASYYQAADIVTLPSDPQENSPVVFLEALATGKIVVTTDTPRNRWLLQDSGVFTDPTDIKAYTRSLTKALSQSASKNQLSKFTWSQVLPQYRQLLQSLFIK